MALSGITSVLMSFILGVSTFFSGLGTLGYFIMNDVTLVEPPSAALHQPFNEDSCDSGCIEDGCIEDCCIEDGCVEECEESELCFGCLSGDCKQHLPHSAVFSTSSYGVLKDCKSDGKSVDEILSVFGLTKELADEAMTCELEYTSTNELYDRAALLYSKSSGLYEANALKGYAEDEILKAESFNDSNYRASLMANFSALHYKVLNYNHPGHLSAHMEKYGDWVGSLIYLDADDYYYGLVYEDYAELALFLDAEYWGEIVQQKIGY